jgi:hypothetical protein
MSGAEASLLSVNNSMTTSERNGYTVLMEKDLDVGEPLVEENGVIVLGDDGDSATSGSPVKPLMIEPEEPYRRVILVTTAMFMGYAILVSFQRKLKDEYGIGNEDSRSHEFSFAVSFLYIGNLIFRLMHNFFFAFTSPRNRVYISVLAMMFSMVILGIFVFVCHYTHTLLWVYLGYIFGGIGVGSFESNILSSITPLGHQTKMWAVLGFPIGFALILIGGFGLSAVGVPPEAMYIGVLVCLVLSVFVFFSLPVVEIKGNSQTLSSFLENLKEFREWAPLIWQNCLALLIDMFLVSLFSGLMLYILNGCEIPLLGQNSNVSCFGSALQLE